MDGKRASYLEAKMRLSSLQAIDCLLVLASDAAEP